MPPRRLADVGVAVTVVEARKRIGGRVHTDYGFAPVPIELGAKFIHRDRAATWKMLHSAGGASPP